MRKLIVAASAAAAFAMPAAAQPRPDEEAVRNLPPPGEIREMGEALARVAEAMMDVDIGPLADAIDPARARHRGRHRQTIGDIASHGDPYARERIRDSIGAATAGMEVAMRQIAILTPVLRRSIEDAQRRVDDAVQRRPRPGDRAYDPDRDYDRDRDRAEDYDRDREYEPVDGRRPD
ncbi:MAG TPA: hypothetical protein VIT45_17265 [Allosphingosinicella sp.]